MLNKVTEIVRLLALPLVLLCIYISLHVLLKFFGLPEGQALLPIVKSWFNHYGLWLVFFGAFIEGFLLLGQYFPGGFIIFLGVVSAGKDIPRASLVVAIVSVAFFLAYTLNYLLGRYGFYVLALKFGLRSAIEQAKERLTSKGLSAVFFSYWEPNLASLTATAAGILQIPLQRFSLYSAGGIVLWNVFWGTLVYSLGDSALKIFVGLKYVLVVFALWFIALLVKKYVIDRRKGQPA